MIGLVGGLGVGAAVHYYRELAKAHTQLRRQLELSMVHAQMSRVFEHASAGDRVGLANYLSGVMAQLKASGATIGVVPAVAPHLAIDEMNAVSPLPIVSMVDAVNRELETRGIRRAALMGTRFAVETNFFGKLTGVDVIQPAPDEITFIHDTYTQLARDGSVSSEQRDRLVAIATALCDHAGVETILLAGTDLALLFDERNTPFSYLDCAGAHIQAIMRTVATK